MVMRHYGDITKLSGYDLPLVDVITGGSPCQDLSVAGKRAGLSGERSGLFMEFVRIVKEMRNASRRTDKYIRPRYMVFENVPGLLSSGTPRGADFQAVLTEIVRVVRSDAPDVPLPERGGYGLKPDVSWDTERTDAHFRLPTEYTTLSFGESPREGAESHLSQILEDCPHPKYALSEKACQGILRRARNKGKTLPRELEQALTRQS